MIQDPSRPTGNLKCKPRSDEADGPANNPLSLTHKAQTSIASGAIETTTTSITSGRRTRSQAAASSLSAAGDSQKSFSPSEKTKRKRGSDPGDQVAAGKAGDQTSTKKARKSTSKATHSEADDQTSTTSIPRGPRGRKRLDRGGKTATRRRSGAPVVEEDEYGDTEG
jgi:hypothetical protein